ncbi:hypothetical protein KPH14_005355 [Odynerus spinipes]|uniref:Uncharacterized protein n=1 Tax=Odynerus spinipes TaxID=1348599 RepID=A0AAD9VJA6_9HYME|nr:hypothetical protein KPH14_005355 [Odynerus spinipes]
MIVAVSDWWIHFKDEGESRWIVLLVEDGMVYLVSSSPCTRLLLSLSHMVETRRNPLHPLSHLLPRRSPFGIALLSSIGLIPSFCQLLRELYAKSTNKVCLSLA